MRTAVIGCSHSAGYSYAGKAGDKDRWLDNNWAEFYINNQNKDGAIFACPGRGWYDYCLLYTSPSPRDRTRSRMPSSA